MRKQDGAWTIRAGISAVSLVLTLGCTGGIGEGGGDEPADPPDPGGRPPPTLGTPPPGDERDGDLVRLNAHEIASRLSYLLRASMPDDGLFAAAAGNKLAPRPDRGRGAPHDPGPEVRTLAANKEIYEIEAKVRDQLRRRALPLRLRPGPRAQAPWPRCKPWRRRRRSRASTCARSVSARRV